MFKKIRKTLRELRLAREIDFLSRVQTLNLKDGDVIILRHPDRLSKAAHEILQKVVEESLRGWGHKIHVLVLEEGMDIGILRKPATAEEVKP